MKYVVWLVVAVIAACGPSSAEVKTAKAAHYTGNAPEMFDIIEQTVAENYKIGDARRSSENDSGFILATVPQWYSPEGGRESAGTGGFVNITDHSINLSIAVELMAADGGGYVVVVTPKTFQALTGSPQPRELKPDDPNLPGWVQGRVDELALAIHKRLEKYAVQ